MIEKLTRIWVPQGTPKENISTKLDGDWHRRLIAKILSERGHLYDDSYRRKWENDRSSYLRFCVDMEDQTHFDYYERTHSWAFYSTEPSPTEEEEPGYKFYGYMGCLSYDDEWEGIFRADLPSPNDIPNSKSFAKRKQFTAKWLPYFRRNCWLSGCDIESTKQERTQWMQGLTAEGIESWRLKL